MSTAIQPLVGHTFHLPGRVEHRPVGGMFDYVLAADGLYLHAERTGIKVRFPIAFCNVRGMGEIEPIFEFNYPTVPEGLVEVMLSKSIEYGEKGLETLFWLAWSPVYPWNNGWELIEPEQMRMPASCRPAEGTEAEYERAIIEIHSHHKMRARFSSRDDADEQGFRLYGVIGNLDETPEIRMRVGVYGNFWEISASSVLELPENLVDRCAEEAYGEN